MPCHVEENSSKDVSRRKDIKRPIKFLCVNLIIIFVCARLRSVGDYFYMIGQRFNGYNCRNNFDLSSSRKLSHLIRYLLLVLQNIEVEINRR